MILFRKKDKDSSVQIKEKKMKKEMTIIIKMKKKMKDSKNLSRKRDSMIITIIIIIMEILLGEIMKIVIIMQVPHGIMITKILGEMITIIIIIQIVVGIPMAIIKQIMTHGILIKIIILIIREEDGIPTIQEIIIIVVGTQTKILIQIGIIVTIIIVGAIKIK